MLTKMSRPQVMFDPANKEHRKWAAGFIRNRTWKDCPVRFTVNDTSLELSNVLQRQLVQYYVSKEFKQ